MSASQQKRVRLEQREQGVEKRQVAQQKAEKAIRKGKRTKAAVWIVVLLVLVGIVGYYSNVLYMYFPAIKVGDVSYTASEYSFFYNYTINNYLNQYKSYLDQIGLDTSKSFDEQTYPDGSGKTWADYFKEQTQDSMKNITAYYAAAQADGYTLDEENQKTLDKNLESIKTCYEGSSYTNADDYLSAMYGIGVNEKLVSSIFTKSAIANAYQTSKQDSYTYTSDELKQYYADNKADLISYTYIAYLVDGSVKDTSTSDSSTTDTASSTDVSSASSTDVSAESASSTDVASSSPSTEDTAAQEAAKEAAMAAAKEKADAVVKAATSKDLFIGAVQALGGSASSSTSKGSELDASYADWIKDTARVAGETTVIKTDTGYYAVYFISRDDTDYSTVNVRHILIKAVASEDGTYSDEAKATAKQKAEDLLAQWKAGDATEDSFSELANNSSEDDGSNTKGGLYENVYKGQMVTNFNDWCFDSSRKAGDTGVVYGESGSYSGYHVIYFVGQGEMYSEKLAEDAKKSADYKSWQTDLLAKYEIKNGMCSFLLDNIK